MNEPTRSTSERWQDLLAWLDFWFQPAKALMHEFDPAERKLFAELAPAWLEAPMGAAKIAVLEQASDLFGRQRVLDLIGKLCADETTGYWSELARTEGGSLDDLVRLLWEPLTPVGFKFSSERLANGLQFCCTRCPHAELARELDATEWFSALVCASDPYIAASFKDLPIRFERTKTLMQDDDCCNHSYFVD